MIVLGISNNDAAGAAIVKDGNVVSAVSDERFTRVKDDSCWPSMSIEYAMNCANITLGDVDYIAYGWNEGFNADIHLLMYVDRLIDEADKNPRGLFYIRQRVVDELKNDKLKRREFDDFVRTSGFSDRTVYLDHHECHAVRAGDRGGACAQLL